MVTISIFSILTVFGYEEKSDLIESAQIKKISFMQDLAKLSRIKFENQERIEESIPTERIIDIGKNEETFNPLQQNFFGFAYMVLLIYS